MLRIQDVKPIEGTKVRLLLTDGLTIERDLAPLMEGKVYEALLHDPDQFSRVTVVDGALTWSGGLDLCPDMTIWGGPPPDDLESRIAS